MIVLSLPWPPSANNLYPTSRAGIRFLSSDGKKYHAEVHARVLEQLRTYPRLAGRLAVTLACNPPDKRRRDLSNVEKAVGDALTKANVWLDDSQIDDLRIVRDVVLVGGRVVVTITELPAERAA